MRILLLLSCLATINLFAQDTFISIKGKLLDSGSNQPIPYASVYIKGSLIGTTTNDDGVFLFHIPSSVQNDTLIVSVIGYDHYKSIATAMVDKENVVKLSPGTTLLNEVVINASEKELTGKEIVRKAVASIPLNYPMKPFMIEGFFRDLQKENGKPVELLEAALRFRYQDYNPGYEDVDIIEVRRSVNKRHPVNGTYNRQNSIIDLMEDNYVKHRFGPINPKGWKFETDSIFAFDQSIVYKISGSKGPSQTAVLFIDSETFAILKLEMKMQMINGEFYRRYLNLPDPYGLQETSFRMIFEFQRIDNKMYLKYQREEDTYNLFNKTTNEVILKQAFMKELFVNNVVKDGVSPAGQKMNMNKSVEGQVSSFNPEFWKYYNVPMETAADSKIIKELDDLQVVTSEVSFWLKDFVISVL